MDSTKIKIHKMLRPFGVARKYVGMPMLVRAVEIAIAHPTSVNAVQKEIYSVIAAENGARWKTIESSIRRYLTVAWAPGPGQDRPRPPYGQPYSGLFHCVRGFTARRRCPASRGWPGRRGCGCAGS